MIKPVSFKECTCDICETKQIVPMEYDMCQDWGWIRYLNPKTRHITRLDLCQNCYEMVMRAIEDVRSKKHK
jgi:hypothetical protein